MQSSVNRYHWIGLDSQGGRVHGDIKASDVNNAQLELKKMHIEVISLTIKSGFSWSNFSLSRKKKIKPKDILFFTRYLSTLIRSGLPIIQSLEIIARDQEKPALKSLIITIKNNTSEGKTLAESFAQFPQYFSELYGNLIKTAEQSGTLDKTLVRLGDHLEKSENLKRKIKKALVYPIAILSVAFIVSLILLLFIVPQFQTLFSSFGAQLPLPTRVVVDLSTYLRNYWWILMLLGGVGFWGGRRYWRASESVKLKIEKLSFRIYILGSVLRNGIIARFSRTLATTFDAGMPIIESMKSMVQIMGSRIYSHAVMQVYEGIVSGHSLSSSMSNTMLFPNMVIQMIAVGEASGKLADMLHSIADHYEEEVNTVVDNLSNLLEPLIMVILGVIVGGFIIAMYLPIFKLGSLY